MNFFGLNRAALNGGVSGVIAGAVLIIVSSGLVVDGTRVVLPTSAVVSSSTAIASGVRTAFGDGGFVTAASMTAFPALLQLQSADIVITSGLQATYTNSYMAATGALQADGYIIRPGTGTASAVSTGTAAPLVTVGYASNINAVSAASADASVKLNGQTTWQRDGYARACSASGLSADGVRIALGYATGMSVSSFATDSIKIHGGAARFDSVFAVSAIASTDAAFAVSTSTGTAAGLVTQYGAAAANGTFGASASQTVFTFGAVDGLAGESAMTADGRLALQAGAVIDAMTSASAEGRLAEQGSAFLAAVASASADGRLALLADATIDSSSSCSADGVIFKYADAEFVASGSLAAQWVILREGESLIACMSGMTADPYTNAESLDPPERTMYRPTTDREMLRPYVNREMKRSV